MNAQLNVGPLRLADGQADTIAAGSEHNGAATQWNLDDGGTRAAGTPVKNRRALVPSIGVPGRRVGVGDARAHVGSIRAAEGLVDAIARYETPSAQLDLGSGDVGACLSVEGTAQKGKLSLGAGAGGLQICRTAAKGDVKSKVKMASCNNDTKRSAEVSSGGGDPPDYDSCLRPPRSQLTTPHITGPTPSFSTHPTAPMYVGPIGVTEKHVNAVAGFETPTSQSVLSSGGNRTVGASNHNCALVPRMGIRGPCIGVEGRTHPYIEAGQSRLWPPAGCWDAALHGSAGAMTPEVKAKEPDVGACLNVEEGAQTGSLSLGAGAGGLLIRRAATKSDANRKGKPGPSRSDDPPGYDSCLRLPGSQLTMPHITGPNASFSAHPTSPMYVGPIRVTERHVNTVAGFETPSSQCDLSSGANRTVGASNHNCALVPSMGIPEPCVGAEGRTHLYIEAGQSRLWPPAGRWNAALHGSVGVMTPEVKAKEPDIGACLSVEASAHTGKLSVGAGAGGPKIYRAATKSDVKCKVKLASSGSATQTGGPVREVEGHRSRAGTGRLLTPASGLMFPRANISFFRL